VSDRAAIDNRVELLILQHPREQKEALATAALTVAELRRARLVIGLSWPNLAAALGRPADPKRWAVLYLGSVRPRIFAIGREIVALDRDGRPVLDQDALLSDLDGAMLLDGSWSEAKALWWRNPWLLKLHRLVLDPRQPSLYHRIRREPRREALSTIEAAALLLSRLERRPEIEAALQGVLERHLAASGPRGGSAGTDGMPVRRRGRRHGHAAARQAKERRG
jgi:DTW domain-containing protein YfiP